MHLSSAFTLFHKFRHPGTKIMNFSDMFIIFSCGVGYVTLSKKSNNVEENDYFMQQKVI